jgi:hypothetical protein
MVAPVQIKQQISEALEKLPSESLSEVLQFVEYLQFKAREPNPKRIVRLRGIWADLPLDKIRRRSSPFAARKH